MSVPNNNGTAEKRSPLLRVLHTIYWIIFAISLVIVLAFAAFKIFIDKPVVDNPEIVIPPTSSVSPAPGQQGGDPTAEPTGDPTAEPTDEPEPLVLHRTDGVYTCLLAGTDDGNGNADTIMLGVFDTLKKQASLISIPRDTLVVMNDKQYKINAVYAYYGLEGLCEAVSDTLCIPVDFYVAVDLEAFVKIVDEVGGIWFTVPQDMEYSDPTQDLYINLKEGYQLLDGKNAMHLMRFRSGYADQDLGRVRVQRSFLAAMVKQTISLSNVSKVTSLIQILRQYVDSNMPLDNMVYFATQAIGMNLDTALNSQTLPGEWIYPHLELNNAEVLTMINNLGIYQEEVPPEALHIFHKPQAEE